jgi:hypothetical protein
MPNMPNRAKVRSRCSMVRSVVGEFGLPKAKRLACFLLAGNEVNRRRRYVLDAGRSGYPRL